VISTQAPRTGETTTEVYADTSALADEIVNLDADHDTLMPIVAGLLRAGDRRLASRLYVLALADVSNIEPDAKALALEVLASARLRWFEPAVFQLILKFLGAEDEALRFAAVASASDLSRDSRTVLRTHLRRMAADDESTDVRAAAQSLLEADTHP
jgi:hypothetical protein